MIVTAGVPGSSGVGFSVPINVARDDHAAAARQGEGRARVDGRHDRPDERGPRGHLRPERGQGHDRQLRAAGSPADKAGAQARGRSCRPDGRTVQDNSELSRYIASPAARATVR